MNESHNFTVFGLVLITTMIIIFFAVHSYPIVEITVPCFDENHNEIVGLSCITKERELPIILQISNIILTVTFIFYIFIALFRWNDS